MSSILNGYVTPAEAGKIIGKSHSSICRYVREGLLRDVKRLGPYILLCERELRRFTPPPVGNPTFRKRLRK